ncbi:hypothetical protein BKA69DRAFT_1076261 [Paraphysoderma sedebokerense]|nr:hypothetical protein BKA69DRAFT_1076261 [Paraphysoderma sedebokerense]
MRSQCSDLLWCQDRFLGKQFNILIRRTIKNQNLDPHQQPDIESKSPPNIDSVGHAPQ